MVFAPYRIAAPPPPDPPEEADAFEAMLRQRTRRSRHVVSALCSFIATASFIALFETPQRRFELHPMEPFEAHRNVARAAIDDARARANAEQDVFARTMLDAIELAPSRVRPCVDRLPEPSALVRSKSFPLAVVARGAREIESPTVARALAELARAEDHFSAGHYAEAESHATTIATQLAKAAHVDVVLVTSSIARPLRTTDKSFEPGAVRGRAYVYDFSEHRVKCAGEIRAESSRQVPYSATSLAASLDEDFDLQIERAIARAL